MARANLAILHENLVDAGTLSASDELTLCPVTELQTKHVARKWRANASSAYVLCDFGSIVSLDAVAGIGMSGDDPTLSVKLSTADPTGDAGDAYSSGSLVSAWDSNYLPFVHILPSVVAARYLKFEISEPGVDFTEMGRLVAGLLTRFERNFTPGWQRAWVDPTVRTVLRSGQTFDDLRDPYRTLNLSLDFLSEDERWGVVEEIDMLLGQSGDMLVVTDPNSDNLSRDSVWGFNETINPVIEPVIVDDGGPRFFKTFNIRERL